MGKKIIILLGDFFPFPFYHVIAVKTLLFCTLWLWAHCISSNVDLLLSWCGYIVDSKDSFLDSAKHLWKEGNCYNSAVWRLLSINCVVIHLFLENSWPCVLENSCMPISKSCNLFNTIERRMSGKSYYVYMFVSLCNADTSFCSQVFFRLRLVNNQNNSCDY